MIRNRSIHLKALILIIVFGLNTVVSFACAVGLDMAFNSKHHHSEGAVKEHGNEDGKNHQHSASAHSHHQTDKKDNCCTDKSAQLSQAEKLVPQSYYNINPIFTSVIIGSYYSAESLFTSKIKSNTRYFTRSYHPPIPDIRIAIQSFQI